MIVVSADLQRTLKDGLCIDEQHVHLSLAENVRQKSAGQIKNFTKSKAGGYE
ncbi:MAG: hypothetical protein PHG34_01480 [Candidatus Cloacimonetes bacterium]|jgi:hypothetical protein|nr:hypothetical protein [Candidatus Cloacimonadota bacterium]MCB5266440.1 hypothetical protein [Candidatus Cloacimonadota bacterium]MDD2422870.1 hypothetical protein [Candidatus Cloacimonadota bacterium]MDD3562219.1 hypothetical protein [Candidatus Cloacimonadota bacterium]